MVFHTTKEANFLDIEGWGEWEDETRDKKVEYMEDIIRSGYVFKKSEWPGGDTSLPLVKHDAKEGHLGKNNMGRRGSKKPENKVLGVRKGKSRATKKRGSGVEEQIKWLVDRVEELTAEVEKLRDKTAELELKGKSVRVLPSGKIASQKVVSSKRKGRRKPKQPMAEE